MAATLFISGQPVLLLFPTRLTPLGRGAIFHRRRPRLLALLAPLVTALAGCREPLRAIGGTPSSGANSGAELLFATLGARVTDPVRNPKYDSARVKITNAAFLPSRVWNDTSVWTSATSSGRTLLIAGRFAEGRYRLDAEKTVPPPSRPADSRHVIHLTRLSDDAYGWDTEVPFAIGTLRASEIGRFVAALFAAAEGRDERSVRTDYRSTLPRASGVLGQLFTVDSIRTTHIPDGSTISAFAVSMTPAGVQGRLPHFAEYMRKYAMTTRLRMTITDRGGVMFLDLSVRDGHLHLRVRTLNGAMIPLAGPARPLPDSLRLNGELTMKVRRYNIGFHDYHADLVIVRTDDERAWSVVSREEPQWTLPLITERLLRTPLRRPFQGSGAQFRIGVRDSSGAQTILMRRLHLEVQESRILRFIGRLGAIALADWAGKAEREQMAWLQEVFEAIVADMRNLS